jgi:hypothetical protein
MMFINYALIQVKSQGITKWLLFVSVCVGRNSKNKNSCKQMFRHHVSVIKDKTNCDVCYTFGRHTIKQTYIITKNIVFLLASIVLILVLHFF